jgi:hypothetical protein
MPAVRRAQPIRHTTAAWQRRHFHIRPFSDTACRAATVPEIDKILLSG